MSKVIEPFKINKNLLNISELDKDFLKITVAYGTIEEPLFTLKNIESILNHKLESLDEFIPDIHYKTCDINENGKITKEEVFTECGLYKSLFMSDTDIAIRFQLFITVVLKQLRLNGKTNLNDINSEYEIKIKKLERENKLINEYLEQEHDQVIKYKNKIENMADIIIEKNYYVEKIKIKNNIYNKSIDHYTDIIDDLIEKYGKKIYINIAEDIEDFGENEILNFYITYKNTNNDYLTILNIKKDITKKEIDEKLINYKNGKYYKCTFDIIKMSIKELNYDINNN